MPKNWFVRLLERIERFPWRLGQYRIIEIDELAADNKRDQPLQHSDVPPDVQQAAIEKMRDRRMDRGE
jgi:hypothetical protein